LGCLALATDMRQTLRMGTDPFVIENLATGFTPAATIGDRLPDWEFSNGDRPHSWLDCLALATNVRQTHCDWGQTSLWSRIGDRSTPATTIGDRPQLENLRMGTDPCEGAQIGDSPEWREVRFRMILLRRKGCRPQSLVEAFVLCPAGATELSPGFQPWESSTKSGAP
jgi:hypothetical protein